MFLKTVMERNQPLVRLGIEWQQNGVILPDTYLLDYDTILENARSIKQAGDANGVQNFLTLLAELPGQPPNPLYYSWWKDSLSTVLAL